MEVEFYCCQICGNVIVKLVDSGVMPECCGESMSLLTPKTKEEGSEKHLPIVKMKNGCVEVRIGSEPHPMTEKHYIQWVCLVTNTNMYFAYLKSTDEPKVIFPLGEEVPVAVYEYCNVHGLWKTDVKDVVNEYNKKSWDNSKDQYVENYC